MLKVTQYNLDLIGLSREWINQSVLDTSISVVKKTWPDDLRISHWSRL